MHYLVLTGLMSSLAFMLTGCPIDPLPPVTPPPVHYPHIVEVNVPSAVQAGVPFDIEIVSSMNSRPEVLTDPGQEWGVVENSPAYNAGVTAGAYHSGQFVGLYTTEVGYAIKRDSQPLSPPTTRYIYRTMLSTPGRHYFYLAHVADASQGGLTFQQGPQFVDEALFEFLEVSVDVLP